MWGSRWSCCGSAGTGSRPLRRLPANHGTGCCLAPGFLCDQRLQSYACLGRESRGKPQDVGVVTGSRPRSGGIETGKNLQSAPSRQDFHSRICPLPAERCGKTFARDGDDPPSPGSGFPTPRCGETGPPPPRPVSGSTRFSSCPKRLAPASTWLSPVATLSGPRSKGSAPCCEPLAPISTRSRPRCERSRPRSEGSRPRCEGLRPRCEGSRPRSRRLRPRGGPFRPRSEGSRPRSERLRPRSRWLRPRGRPLRPRCGPLGDRRRGRRG